MAVLCILAWVPTIMSQFPPIPNGGEDQLAQSGYGGTPLPGQFYVAANGRHIMQYASSSKYKLVASLYFDDGAQAEIDAPNLQKSAPYDLSDRELIEIAIKPSPGYIQSFNGRMVKGGTKFALLLVPNNVSPSNFSTIREAQKLGASYLWGGAVAGPQTVPR